MILQLLDDMGLYPLIADSEMPLWLPIFTAAQPPKPDPATAAPLLALTPMVEMSQIYPGTFSIS